MHLVVSGSGQLGTALVRQLTAAGRPVRAFVRPTSRHQHLEGAGVELAFGDLRDAASVRAALTGADIVLACANIHVPRGDDTFETMEAAGYRSLIEEAARQGIQRFVYTSVPVSPVDEQVPGFRAKRRTEEALMGSGVPYTILRCAPFMEVWLALRAAPSRCVRNRTRLSTAPTRFCVASVNSPDGPSKTADACW